MDTKRFRVDGERYLFICHVDITERKRAERKAAAEQYARHLVEAHSTAESAVMLDGMVHVRAGDDEWKTVPIDEAKPSAVARTSVTVAYSRIDST